MSWIVSWGALLAATVCVGAVLGADEDNDRPKFSGCALFNGDKAFTNTLKTFDYYDFLPDATSAEDYNKQKKTLTDYKQAHLPPQLWCKQLSDLQLDTITWVCVRDQLRWAGKDCISQQCSVQMVTEGGKFKGFNYDCSVTTDSRNYIDHDPKQCPDFLVPTGLLTPRMELAYNGIQGHAGGILDLNTPSLERFRCVFAKPDAADKSSGYSQLICADKVSSLTIFAKGCIKNSCRVVVTDPPPASQPGTRPDKAARQLQLDCNHPTSDPDFPHPADTPMLARKQTTSEIGDGTYGFFSCVWPWIVSVPYGTLDPLPKIEYYHYGAGWINDKNIDKGKEQFKIIWDFHGPKRYLSAVFDDLTTTLYCNPGFEPSDDTKEKVKNKKPYVWWCVYDLREWPSCIDRSCIFRKTKVDGEPSYIAECGVQHKDMTANLLDGKCGQDFVPKVPPNMTWTVVEYLLYEPAQASQDRDTVRHWPKLITAQATESKDVKDLAELYCSLHSELGLPADAPHRRFACYKKSLVLQTCLKDKSCRFSAKSDGAFNIGQHFEMTCDTTVI